VAHPPGRGICVVRGIPEDRIRYHICWGSWAGPHISDVPLAAIVDLVLRINAQAYSVEAGPGWHRVGCGAQARSWLD
jgi:hypothetical protein